MNHVEPPMIARARRLDQVCNRFEAAWKTAANGGTIPDWQDYLLADDDDTELRSELLEIDLHYRQRHSGPSETRSYNAGLSISDVGDIPLPPVPEGFSLLGVIARGGMGVVYRARQPLLQRDVAIKVIRDAAFATTEQRMRFMAEAEAIAALNHPGVVQVYQFGTCQGSPYLALEFCSGGTLAGRIVGGPLPARDAAEMVERVASAVQAAHDRGIIHRDLKPANILLTDNGVPKVSDFGLARRSDGIGLTVTGDILGTPAYMSPEQAVGRKAGATTDVYSLGAILYECLTGRPPFIGANAGELIQRVIREEPVSLSRLTTTIPRDLATICHRCLNKLPTDRFATPGALAEDLRAFLEGRPIRARRVTGIERVVKWSKRYPVVAGMSFAIALLLIAGSFVSTYFALQSRQRARDAEQARDDAKEQARAARLSAVRMYRDRGLISYKLGDGADGMLWHTHALAHLPDDDTAARDELALQVGAWMQHVPELMQVFPYPGKVYSVSISPDGARVAVGGSDATVRIFDAETGLSVCPPLQHPGEVPAVRFTRDGKKLLSTCRPDSARFWDAQTGAPISDWIRIPANNTVIAIHPTEPVALVGGINEPPALLGTDTCQPITPNWTIKPPTDVYSASFSQDGKMFALGQSSGDVHFLEWPSGKPIRQHIKLATTNIFGLALLSPDQVAVASWQNHAGVFDTKTGKELWSVKRLPGQMFAAVLSPSGQLLFGGGDGYCRIADLNGRNWPVPLKCLGPVRSIATDAKGKTVVTGSEDGFARLWNLAPPDLRESTRFLNLSACTFGESRVLLSNAKGTHLSDGSGALLPAPNAIASALSPGEQFALTVGLNKKYQIWNIATGKAIGAATDCGFDVRHARFSPDGQHAIIWGWLTPVLLIDARTGKLKHRLELKVRERQYYRGALQAGFSKDSRILLAGGAGWSIHRWRVDDGELLDAQKTPRESWSYSMSVGDDSVAVGQSENEVLRFGVFDGQQRQPALPHPGIVWSVRMSDDGQRLLTGCNDSLVRQWDLQTGQMIGRAWEGHARPVHFLDYHPTRPLALTADQLEVRLWDLNTIRPLGPPLSFVRPITQARFDSRGVTMQTFAAPQARMSPVPTPTAKSPEELRLWIAVHFGLEVSESEEAVTLTPAEWHERWRRYRGE